MQPVLDNMHADRGRLRGLCHQECQQFVDSSAWIVPQLLHNYFTHKNLDSWHWNIKKKDEKMSVVGVDKTLAINYTDPGEISVAYGSRLLQQDAHYWEIGHIYCGDGDSCSHFGIITMTSRYESDTVGLPTLQESPPSRFYGIDTTGRIWQNGKVCRQSVSSHQMRPWTVVGFLFDGTKNNLSIYVDWSLVTTLCVSDRTRISVLPTLISRGETALSRLRAVRWSPLSLRSMCLAEIRRCGGVESWKIDKQDLPPELLNEIRVPLCSCATREYNPSEIMDGHVPRPGWCTQYCC